MSEEHNKIEFIFRPVIWLLLYLNLRFSFYSVYLQLFLDAKKEMSVEEKD